VSQKDVIPRLTRNPKVSPMIIRRLRVKPAMTEWQKGAFETAQLKQKQNRLKGQINSKQGNTL
jgi:hypothetical protein